jgi:hypothetical protein
MRYLLLLYEPERPPDMEIPKELLEKEMAAYADFTAEVRNRGLFQAGEALEPVTTATTVRVRDGKTLTTDGPFAETKEALGGFYLLNCRDLDEAIELAARIPAASRGSIEVRPIWELPSSYDAAVAAAGSASAG